MRFFVPALLLTLSSSALAAIIPVQFFASSDNEKVNGQGLYSTHEGAGINYFFLGAGQTLQYNDETRVVYVDVDTQPLLQQNLTFLNNILSLTFSRGSLPADIAEDGSVTFLVSDALAAAKNINDPYSYSESKYAVVKVGGEGSIPLTLSAKFGDAEEEQQSTSGEEASEPTETPAEEESTSVAAPGVNEEPEVTSYEGSAAAVGGAGLAAIAFAAASLVFYINMRI
ncbi:hypothetical protein CORT_0B00220 [Candida orthopsilosis Co 90-125]|uniref:Uncharacterized protein n=1 Tax=Candida orthopsilosis (strain 90-125) TaxID=1136231 RepID=H8WZ77_CANO9|nr:hypothetical protein CORT_0B00220 [Candida orthopsilosis Co 90-125]CCG21745.1 hypothetical protein CORT_0B00220 [Candida orthopsilosis Co 90-125]